MTPEQAQQKYHWVKYDKLSNTIELYLDNFMLSTARICEAKFYMEHMLHIKPKYDLTKRKPWFFDFGEYIHWCLEQFYKSFKKSKQAPNLELWINDCKKHWAVMKMDDYANSDSPKDQSKYEDVHGWEGVCGLLIEYYAYYMNMRMRVIDTEITFGHNKEVFLGEFLHPMDRSRLDFDKLFINWKVKCYLTGRIDVLADNGYKIGPIDHKNTHVFDGYEHNDFNPHDGMTGYILAINEIMGKYREEGLTNLPKCMGGWIQHISAKHPSTNRKTKLTGPRFKTTPIDKTISQLEDYKARQLSTFKRIAELLFNNKTPEWNSVACNNIFFRPCEYKTIHEQPSEQWNKIIEDHYVIGEPWDTRKHSGKEESNVSGKEEEIKITQNT